MARQKSAVSRGTESPRVTAVVAPILIRARWSTHLEVDEFERAQHLEPRLQLQGVDEVRGGGVRRRRERLLAQPVERDLDALEQEARQPRRAAQVVGLRGRWHILFHRLPGVIVTGGGGGGGGGVTSSSRDMR